MEVENSSTDLHPCIHTPPSYSPPPVPLHLTDPSLEVEHVEQTEKKHRVSSYTDLRNDPSATGKHPSKKFLRKVGPQLLPHDLPPPHVTPNLPDTLPPSPPPTLYVISEEDEEGVEDDLGVNGACPSVEEKLTSFMEIVTEESDVSDEDLPAVAKEELCVDNESEVKICVEFSNSSIISGIFEDISNANPEILDNDVNSEPSQKISVSYQEISDKTDDSTEKADVADEDSHSCCVVSSLTDSSNETFAILSENETVDTNEPDITSHIKSEFDAASDGAPISELSDYDTAQDVEIESSEAVLEDSTKSNGVDNQTNQISNHQETDEKPKINDNEKMKISVDVSDDMSTDVTSHESENAGDTDIKKSSTNESTAVEEEKTQINVSVDDIGSSLMEKFIDEELNDDSSISNTYEDKDGQPVLNPTQETISEVISIDECLSVTIGESSLEVGKEIKLKSPNEMGVSQVQYECVSNDDETLTTELVVSVGDLHTDEQVSNDPSEINTENGLSKCDTASDAQIIEFSNVQEAISKNRNLALCEESSESSSSNKDVGDLLHDETISNENQTIHVNPEGYELAINDRPELENGDYVEKTVKDGKEDATDEEKNDVNDNLGSTDPLVTDQVKSTLVELLGELVNVPIAYETLVEAKEVNDIIPDNIDARNVINQNTDISTENAIINYPTDGEKRYLDHSWQWKY